MAKSPSPFNWLEGTKGLIAPAITGFLSYLSYVWEKVSDGNYTLTAALSLVTFLLTLAKLVQICIDIWFKVADRKEREREEYMQDRVAELRHQIKEREELIDKIQRSER